MVQEKCVTTRVFFSCAFHMFECCSFRIVFLASQLLLPLGMAQSNGRARVVVERVRPEIDNGRFPVKCIAGDSVTVEADIFTDGQDLVTGEILYRLVQEETWRRGMMKSIG